MTLNISHRGIELTPAIHDYVEEKMASLNKYSQDIQHIDVEVGLTSGHHQKGKIFECKANIQVAGKIIHLEKEAEDLYKAIDKVRDHLRAELSDLKKRLSRG